MNILKKTLVQLAALAALGVIVGFTANAVRASGSIRFTKNYFARGFDLAKPTERGEASPGEVRVGDRDEAQMHVPGAPLAGAAPAASPADDWPEEAGAPAAMAEDEGHVEHPYQSISTKEVFDLFQDPGTAWGVSLFVDARSDQAYGEGHIPGAFQVDPYNPGDYIDAVLEREPGAEKIVVYCNGGDCEDSIFLCRDLIYEFNIPYEKVYLYEGGWKAWKRNDLPVETGRP